MTVRTRGRPRYALKMRAKERGSVGLNSFRDLLQYGLPGAFAIGAVVAVVTQMESRWQAVVILAFVVALLPRRAQVASIVLAIAVTGLIRRITAGANAWVPNDPLIALPYAAMAAAVMTLLLRGEVSHIGHTALKWPTAVYLGSVVLLAPVGILNGGAVAMLATAGYLLPPLTAIALCGDERGREVTLRSARSALAVIGPATALYGIYQFSFPPVWDITWLNSRQEYVASFGRPVPGELRIWSTLDSPLSFALFLAIACLAVVTLRLSVFTRTLLILPMVVALTLTGVRTAWFGIVLAVLAWSLRKNFSPGRLVSATAGTVAFFVVVPVLLQQLGLAGSDRISVNDLGQDTSFNARLDLLTAQSLRVLTPPWTGPGTTSSGSTVLDNGYIALGIEVGVLALLAAVLIVWRSWRLWSRAAVERHDGGAIFAVYLVVLLAFAQTSAPVLQGAFGVLFWIIVFSAPVGYQSGSDPLGPASLTRTRR